MCSCSGIRSGDRRFGANPNAIGRVLDLDGSAYTIVGILPADFRYAGEPIAGTATDVDVWLPLADNALVGERTVPPIPEGDRPSCTWRIRSAGGR